MSREHVGHAGALCRPPNHRLQEVAVRMDVHDVERADVASGVRSYAPRQVELAVVGEPVAQVWEAVDDDAVDRLRRRRQTPGGVVRVGRPDGDLLAEVDQRPAQFVRAPRHAAVGPGGGETRRDVEDPHGGGLPGASAPARGCHAAFSAPPAASGARGRPCMAATRRARRRCRPLPGSSPARQSARAATRGRIR